MKTTYQNTLIALLAIVILASCASKKRKDDNPSVLSKFYHNTTAYYNGYFNANELLELTYLQLEEAHNDDFTEIISVYSYDNVPDVKVVNPEMDKAIEKVVKVATLHENSKWIDDCYVLMAEAQYVKQDYETAEETLLYFQDDFNPANPNGRNYKNKGLTKKEKAKIKEKERELAKVSKENEREAREKEREERAKQKEKERKEREKAKKEERKAREKERERKAKERKEARKKGKSSRTSRKTKERPVATEKEKSTKETEEKTTTTDSSTQGDDKKEDTSKKEVIEDKKEEEEEDNYDLAAELKKKKEEEAKKKNKKTAYAKGQLLLAKTYVARDNYSSASYLLDKIIDEGASEDIIREIPVVQADIFIKQKQYDLAATSLKEAIEKADKKYLKARYAFIIGQIYTQQKRYDEASKYFTDAKKWSKDFKLEFASELNMEKNLMLSGKKSKEEVDSKLNKMLKEDKYIEQRDQIYFVQGEIHYEEENHDKAVESFTKSIANNVSNPPLKIEAYYRLGELKFDQEDYVSAKNYYDSTLMVMNIKDVKYPKVKEKADNLIEIANNIEIIELNDSLITLTKMSDEELRKVAATMIKEDEAPKKSDAVKEARTKSGFYSSTSSVFGKSDFPFYDPQTRDRGKTSFEKKWGYDRPLVDNWRRKADLDNTDTRIDEDLAEVEKEEENKEAKINEALRELKSSLPYSGGKKDQVNSTLEVAYYALGTLYRTNLNHYEKSAETLEKLLREYPRTPHILDTYYYLYLNYKDLGNSRKVAFYKNKIQSDFPDSNFAKVIDNPAYANTIRDNEKQLETFYEETYALFQQGEYKDVKKRADDSETLFGVENEYHLKFELLNTMALGSVNGRDVYVNGLRNYIQKYPNTEEQTMAKELLRLLVGKDEFSAEEVIAARNEFSTEFDGLHYFAVVLKGVDSKTVTKVKIAISNYNKKYHKSDRLRIGDVTLNRDNKTEIIFLRRYDDKDDVMKYYNSAMKSIDEFIGEKDLDFSIYGVTQANYRLLLQDQSDDRYKKFFEENYLN